MSRRENPPPQVQLLSVRHGDEESSDLHELLKLLDEEERSRAALFPFARDRQLYVRAHVQLRRVLSLNADVAPEDWRFERGTHGKPALCRRHHPALHDLRFNLAHCQGMAAVVVAQGREVGIDVENLDAILDNTKTRDPHNN
jgi:4'-phosphopantetheinyl transferase